VFLGSVPSALISIAPTATSQQLKYSLFENILLMNEFCSLLNSKLITSNHPAQKQL